MEQSHKKTVRAKVVADKHFDVLKKAAFCYRKIKFYRKNTDEKATAKKRPNASEVEKFKKDDNQKNQFG